MIQMPKKHLKIASPKRPTVVRIVSASVTGSTLTVTFDQPVILKGIPQYSTDILGPTPASAVMTGPATLSLTFSNVLTGAAQLNVPVSDPGIRSPAGGYVADSLFLL